MSDLSENGGLEGWLKVFAVKFTFKADNQKKSPDFFTCSLSFSLPEFLKFSPAITYFHEHFFC